MPSFCPFIIENKKCVNLISPTQSNDVMEGKLMTTIVGTNLFALFARTLNERSLFSTVLRGKNRLLCL